jgi:hypothetical protein
VEYGSFGLSLGIANTQQLWFCQENMAVCHGDALTLRTYSQI